MIFWWSRRDSNPQGLLHTLLRRTRIPIPPRDQFLNYKPIINKRQRIIPDKKSHPAARSYRVFGDFWKLSEAEADDKESVSHHERNDEANHIPDRNA